ncbi:MAG: DinB family protein [Actinomycetota bacterium]
MKDIPAENYSPRWGSDNRVTPPLVGDERGLLTAYLDWHRQSLVLKCAGVPEDRLSEHVIPPSTLTLHGLVRHLTGVERWWFQIQFAGLDVPMLYYSDDDPGQDFDSLDGDFGAALDAWQTECAKSRSIVVNTASFDETGIQNVSGKPISLRRIMLLVTTEYARHLGHADLLRERIDGAIGF